MTAARAFATQPVGTRPSPGAQAGGTTTTTYWVDARGLPRKVVEVYSWRNGSYSEVFTFAGWGSRVTVAAPR